MRRHTVPLLLLFALACDASPAPEVAPSEAAIAGGFCLGKSYLDVHAHAASQPTAYANANEFFAELDVIQADAEANGGAVNLIVNLDGARWFSERNPNPYDRIVLTGIVRPQARNTGQLSSGGHGYPVGATAAGDPLSHVALYAGYGVRAIKLLSKHNSHTGLEPDADGDHWVGHCGDWDTGAPGRLTSANPRPNYQVIEEAQVNRGPARTYCADYDDDLVWLGADEIGAPRPTFLEYFREAARYGLSVVVHGEENFDNERTGTPLMGHETLVRALNAVRADSTIPRRLRDRFEVLMLHGPNRQGEGIASHAAVVNAFESTPGLWWEIGGLTVGMNAAPRNGPLYVDATRGDQRRRREALRAHLDPDGDGRLQLASRMMFGVDGLPGLTPGLSSSGYRLARDLLSASDTVVPGEPLQEIFCLRAARFLRL